MVVVKGANWLLHIISLVPPPAEAGQDPGWLATDDDSYESSYDLSFRPVN